MSLSGSVHIPRYLRMSLLKDSWTRQLYSLKFLGLRMHHQPLDKKIKALFETSTRLERLIILESEISEDILNHVVENCDQLRTLQMKNTIFRGSYNKLAEAPMLRSVELGTRPTPKELRYIRKNSPFLGRVTQSGDFLNIERSYLCCELDHGEVIKILTHSEEGIKSILFTTIIDDVNGSYRPRSPYLSRPYGNLTAII